jgi:putative transposase
MKLTKDRRISEMELHEIYFWTDTILDWKYLLTPDKYKWLIINTWRDLVKSGHITIYAFVIMPNHLHALWQLNEMNGREKPNASFNKKTGHEIRNDLEIHHPLVLERFRVSAADRTVQIWQRDPLAVLMDTKKKFIQKMDYIHYNPVVGKWNLAPSPEEYYWSSASFYETGESDFDFITDYRTVF